MVYVTKLGVMGLHRGPIALSRICGRKRRVILTLKLKLKHVPVIVFPDASLEGAATAPVAVIPAVLLGMSPKELDARMGSTNKKKMHLFS